MNPAAPSPSDSSIAQAFREIIATATPNEWVESVGITYIIKRAAEIDASAPAAAVGGGEWLLELMGAWDTPMPTGMFDAIVAHKEVLSSDSQDNEDCACGGSFVTACCKCGEPMPRPAAPVGGFVVVPAEATHEMCEAAHFGPNCAEEKLRSSDREFWEACWRAMVKASPAAQDGIDPALEAAAVPLPESLSTRVNNLRERAAQPSAKDGVRGEG